MARVPGSITKVLGTIWVIRPKALGHEMRIREKGSGVMFGTETISESEMRRRTENVGLSVQSVRLEGGDVTRAFIRDAGEYARGSIGSAELLSRTRRRYGLE